MLWRDGERSVLGDSELRFLLGLSGEEAVVKENCGGGEGEGRGFGKWRRRRRQCERGPNRGLG